MGNNYLLWIESEIKKQKFGTEPKSLYEPLRYIMGLGGKRLRPMLTLLSYALYKNDVQNIVPLSLSVEVFHNFTLLHDDIMDNAPLRRGKTAVHKKWNTNTAILAGDVMQVKVYEILMGIDDAKLRETLVALTKCAIEVCEGQQWDMEFETRNKVTVARYLAMIRLKTAVLLGFCLELGAILGDAPQADKKAIREFGIYLGIGFQLKDDLLDVYADKNKFGKLVGGDIIANKKTFLLIQALEKAKGKHKMELAYWLSLKKFDRREKVKTVTALYDSLGIRELTEKQINDYFLLALRALDKISVPEKNKLTLKNFTLALMDRQA